MVYPCALILTRAKCIIVIFLENLQIASLDCLPPHVLKMPPTTQIK